MINVGFLIAVHCLQSDYERDVSVDVIKDILHVIPESVSAEDISPWLANSFIPFVIRVIPDSLVGVTCAISLTGADTVTEKGGGAS